MIIQSLLLITIYANTGIVDFNPIALLFNKSGMGLLENQNGGKLSLSQVDKNTGYTICNDWSIL